MSLERRPIKEFASKLSPFGFALLGFLFAEDALFAGSVGNEKQAKTALILAATCFTIASIDSFKKGTREQ